jgi:hypothetical protein
MIVRKEPDGELILMGQTDHSRLVGQLAAHWGNSDFETPRPYQSVVRAAVFHDYGWLSYETNPQMDPKTGEPYEFRQTPFSEAQLGAYQWCIDWLSGIDRYSGLIASMHRTGLWKARYQKINHPTTRYNPSGVRPEISQFIERNEARQEQDRKSFDEKEVWTNYSLQQVWDLLGLYFCCQEPYDEHIEPVPVSYSSSNGGVNMTMKPLGNRQVKFDPYPFNERPLKIQITSKRLPATSYPDLEAFRRSYFQAQNEMFRYELV